MERPRNRYKNKKRGIYMKKRVMMGIAATVLTVAVSVPAYAGEWKSNGKGYWWQAANGSYPTNCSMFIDGNNDGVAELFYFDSEGYMLANTDIDNYHIDNEGYCMPRFLDGSGYLNERISMDVQYTLAQNYKDAKIPDNLCGVYFGKHGGETVNCFISVVNGYYYYVTEFGAGPLGTHIGNGVFENEEEKFIFSGNHLTMIDKLDGNETYELER